MNNLYTIRKTFNNGGVIMVMNGVVKERTDYRDIITIATLFAKMNFSVKVLSPVHYKSEEYRQVFGRLIGTKFERKCPDLLIDGNYYEYESYERPWNKRKISSMISHGLQQASRIIIDNNKGASDRFIRKCIMARLNLKNQHIDEVWIYEKGQLRLFFKEALFIKTTGR
ncbi:MAG: hypothetical protein II453_20940 [Alphaproteobacteria bacterium]|nr:hypothetical protein [Alphaproteobacteria bacterium]